MSEESGTQAEQTDLNENQDLPQKDLPTEEVEKELITVEKQEMDSLKQEVQDLKDKYLRTLADYENSRKRIHKERIDSIKYANESVFVDILTPLDNFENALSYAKNMSEEVKNWATGFQMILTQFRDILTNNGVTAFESKGKQFDPHIHEAVEMVESEDLADGMVVEEFNKGYKMGDKVIRPARVCVSKNRPDCGDSTETEKLN